MALFLLLLRIDSRRRTEPMNASTSLFMSLAKTAWLRRTRPMIGAQRDSNRVVAASHEAATRHSSAALAKSKAQPAA